MQGIIELHHDLVFFLILVLSFVFWLLFRAISEFSRAQHVISTPHQKDTLIEII